MSELSADDLDRLLRLLREDPARQAQLRQLLADETSARLTSAVEALAEAQRRTEESLATLTARVDALTQRVDRLADAQGRTEANLAALTARTDALTERVDRLADAQRRTEESLVALTARVDALTERVDQLTQRVDALTQRMDELTQRVDALTARVDLLTQRVDQLTQRVDALTERVEALTDRLDRLTLIVEGLTGQMSELTGQMSELTGHVAWLRGEAIERRYRERPHSYLNRVIHRAHLLTPSELDDLLDAAVERGALTSEEADQVRTADAVFRGRRATDRSEVYVVLEASAGVGVDDVVRASERAALLRRAGLATEAVVGGTWVVPDAAQAARAHGVWQVTDGRTVAPAA